MSTNLQNKQILEGFLTFLWISSFLCQNSLYLKMFTSSASRKQPLDSSEIYNLRPLPMKGTNRRNPDEDFVLNGFSTDMK